MAAKTQYNLRNPAVKRLMKEAAELRSATELYCAQPLDDNLFEWHFSVRGPPDTDFEGGIYHGRIILPPEYPMKPPNIFILTPNGRFEINKKICLSISGHHPESWQPSWSIRTALLAIIGFMPTHGGGAIGSLDYSPDERKILAKRSQEWKCQTCNVPMKSTLPALTEASKQTNEEAKEIAKQVSFKDEKETVAASREFKEITPETSDSQSTPTQSSGETSTSATSTSSPNEAGEAGQPTILPRSNSQAQMLRTPVSAEIRHRNVNEADGNGSFVVIVVVSLMIAALLFRRLYIINEWRFHSSSEEL